MTRLFAAALALGLAAPATADDTGFAPLFDGKSAAGWLNNHGQKPVDAKAVADGSLCPNKLGDCVIYTEKTYGDFVLSLDYKVAKGANGGVFLRYSDPKKGDYYNYGFEIQIMDDAGTKPNKNCTGSLYDIAAPKANPTKPAGEWNTMVVTCDGPKILVKINGEDVLSSDLDQYPEVGKNLDGSKNKYKFAAKDFPRAGHIGLQGHGKDVWYKNVKVKELK